MARNGPLRTISNFDEMGGASAATPSYERSVGSDQFATGQASSSVAPAAATQIVPARPGRRSVTITNTTGSQPTYFLTGNRTDGATTGFFLAGTVGASVTIPTTAAIFGTSPTAAQVLAYVETF